MFDQVARIFLDVIGPVLLMVGIGALVQRYRALDVTTLVRLNLYIFVPVFLFVRVSESQLSLVDIGGIGLAVLLPIAALGVPLYYVLRGRGTTGDTVAAIVIGGLFFNAGNFGLAVAELAFGEEGGKVQSLVVMFMNTSIFFIGYFIIALAQGKGAKGCLGYFKLPMIYAIVGAFVVRGAAMELPTAIDKALRTVASGLVPVALITLGAQLATRARWPKWKVITPVVVMKLGVLPLATAGVVWMLGLWPWPGAQLILASAGPTAVNTLLLSLELDGDADTAADCVFWTTLICCVTVTCVLAVIRMWEANLPGAGV